MTMTHAEYKKRRKLLQDTANFTNNNNTNELRELDAEYLQTRKFIEAGKPIPDEHRIKSIKSELKYLEREIEIIHSQMSELEAELESLEQKNNQFIPHDPPEWMQEQAREKRREQDELDRSERW